MVKKEVNVLIWEELDECVMEEKIGKFLKEILLFEREHLGEKSPRFSDEYDKLIDKYSKKGDLNEAP